MKKKIETEISSNVSSISMFVSDDYYIIKEIFILSENLIGASDEEKKHERDLALRDFREEFYRLSQNISCYLDKIQLKLNTEPPCKLTEHEIERIEFFFRNLLEIIKIFNENNLYIINSSYFLDKVANIKSMFIGPDQNIVRKAQTDTSSTLKFKDIKDDIEVIYRCYLENKYCLPSPILQQTLEKYLKSLTLVIHEIEDRLKKIPKYVHHGLKPIQYIQLNEIFIFLINDIYKTHGLLVDGASLANHMEKISKYFRDSEKYNQFLISISALKKAGYQDKTAYRYFNIMNLLR